MDAQARAISWLPCPLVLDERTCMCACSGRACMCLLPGHRHVPAPGAQAFACSGRTCMCLLRGGMHVPAPGVQACACSRGTGMCLLRAGMHVPAPGVRADACSGRATCIHAAPACAPAAFTLYAGELSSRLCEYMRTHCDTTPRTAHSLPHVCKPRCGGPGATPATLPAPDKKAAVAAVKQTSEILADRLARSKETTAMRGYQRRAGACTTALRHT
eukprot:364912-Chlamydomonas_euryale.AAC.17